MGEILSLEERRKKKRRIRRIIRLCLLGVLAIGLVLLYLNRETLQNFDPAAILDSDKDAEGSGFPLTLPSSNTYDMYCTESKLLLLTDTHIYIYNTAGKLLFSAQHGMNHPNIVYTDTRSALFERGGTRIWSINLTTLKSSTKTLELPIYDLCYSQNNRVCVIYNSTRYVSELVVYSPNWEEQYRWSSQSLVSAASFADNNTIGAIAIGTDGGKVVSTVYVLPLDKQDFLGVHEFPGNMLLSIDAKSNGQLVAIGDKGAVSISKTGELTASINYGSQPLSYFENREDWVLLTLGDYTAFKANEIVVLDSKLGELTRYASEDKILDQSTDTKRVAVLFDHYVMLYEDGLFSRLHSEYGKLETLWFADQLLLRSASDITVAEK